MNNPTPPNKIDRFRGWSLAALYGALAILAALLAYAAYRIWPAADRAAAAVFLLAGTGSATAVVSMRTCLQFIDILRRSDGIPRVALTPFVGITLTLLAASYLFGML